MKSVTDTSFGKAGNKNVADLFGCRRLFKLFPNRLKVESVPEWNVLSHRNVIRFKNKFEDTATNDGDEERKLWDD